ncbi:WD40 repeat-like protein [Fomitiporia mediterranea MF3/22]|uniref:WD40 repeat-like protein n=1 Tax=Fomitiporia mediterranea (strain MF3/22) TaxID=694068 RepID=UPI0004407AC1|nr:WD40 repeat-like protein [Fomitiporia mediterranea MF3/22]EJD08073.1 WD40 repeat-like protein [Fomitiporia mediterranea MF3/22]
MRSDTSERPRCLQNTRTEYLSKIKDWLHSPSTETNILWLNGIAGSGKSTIAASIMDYCDLESRLAAFIFFERRKSEPKSVIKTIAYQLAAFNSELAKRIISAAEQLRNITGSTLMTQFETLLLGPLRDSVDVVGDPVIIILDALDECGSTEQRQEILKLLKDDFAQLPEKFRFFITSRPENDIMTSLSLRPHISEIKLDPTLDQSRSDVHAYINDAIRNAVTDPIPAGFVCDSNMEILGDAAGGLFIWASTVVKLVSRSDDKVEKLEELVENARSLVGLDSLYGTVLEQSGISWEEDKSVERFRKILGLILLGKQPLSDDDIDKLSDLQPGKSHLMLRRLHSVLSYEPGKPVRLHHASFADYLLSPERSGDQRWFVDTNIQRHTITVRCFDVMEQLLHFNMCSLETSFICNDKVPELEKLIAKNIPLHLSYACRFWAEHLGDIPHSADVVRKLTDFAYNYMLYWLEVLTLTKQFKRVAGRALLDAIIWASLNNDQLSSFLWDAYRLAGIYASPVSQSTPQIYLSMLSLSKGESEVSKHFSQTHPAIETYRSGTKVTTACIKNFIGHTGQVISVGFSPDGKHVVSGSDDWTIRIWDASSGEAIAGPFEGHTSSVRSVSFSPDGKHIVSGSYDKTIRIWDASSGEVVAGPFEGHTHSVTSVSFSPDGKRVVSGSGDKTICIWDASSGEAAAGPFEGHIHSVTSVGFSPDGKHVVSGSGDSAIRILDASSGEVVAGPFEGHTSLVMSVSFSPDGKRIVSGSCDDTIRIWDAASGKVVARPFEGHTDWVRSVGFSPDGKRVVVACPFVGHTESVTSVSFSLDGKRVVTGSHDSTIRIWDASSGEVVAGPFEGHADLVWSVGFSPDGKHVVSGSHDRTIRIWDLDSSTLNMSATTSNWTMSEDGWILGRQSELLTWVPPDLRPTLFRPCNTAVFSCPFATRIDFSTAPIGTKWAEGFGKKQ